MVQVGSGLVYYVMASSDQLADALRNAERYSKINNEGVRLHFRMQGGTAVIALDYVNVDRDAERHQIEFWLVTLVHICRHAPREAGGMPRPRPELVDSAF
jgi:hypothetical protein